MKTLLVFAVTLPALAGNFEIFTDNAANYTQRNEACYALRGDKSPEVVEAMRVALSNTGLQACAAAGLRLAGATDQLLAALKGPDASARAVAARELGATGNHDFIPALRAAASAADLLVASNAIEGLARYEDHATAPQLREIAGKGGVLTSLAVNTLVEWHDPELLNIARQLLEHKDPGDQITAIRVIAQMGGKEDLPRLQELAKDDNPLSAGARGFGLMPAISVAKAAKTAIAGIRNRT